MLGFAGCPLMPGRFELVAVAGNQAAFAFVDVRQRPETVPLDLEQTLWMDKGLSGATKGHGLERWEGHSYQYSECPEQSDRYPRWRSQRNQNCPHRQSLLGVVAGGVQARNGAASPRLCSLVLANFCGAV
jgi:hypothetical protein